MPISVTTTCVSGSMRASVSGSPISLLYPASAAAGSCARSQRAQSLAGRLAIIEWHRPIRELLPLLRALACKQHHVAIACQLDRVRDRARSIRFDLDLAHRARDNRIENCLRVL